MNFIECQERKNRGTFNFPIEFHHVDKLHPRYQMPFHWHMEYELIRVISGELSLSLNEDNFVMENGDCVLISDGVLHGGIPETCIYECLVFDLNSFLDNCNICKGDIDDLQSHKIILNYEFKVGSHECKLINQLFDCFKEERKGYEFIIQGLLYQLVGIILGHHQYSKSDDVSVKSVKRIHQLKKSLKKIREEYSSQLTLDDLAKTAQMSPKYFCRFFADLTGKTPIEYLNYYRIECAAEQLLYTDYSVTDIALNCGFNDLSYFVKTFKRYKTITPKQYKKV
ncbi:MAG: AraC family transcriptional regulator [Oscillospiraceae bacterium]